jgi:hypothetical protein
MFVFKVEKNSQRITNYAASEQIELFNFNNMDCELLNHLEFPELV